MAISYCGAGEVFSYYESDEKASPGALAVKVESKTHVYLALDYTNDNDAKLVAMEEVSRAAYYLRSSHHSPKVT